MKYSEMNDAKRRDHAIDLALQALRNIRKEFISSGTITGRTQHEGDEAIRWLEMVQRLPYSET